MERLTAKNWRNNPHLQIEPTTQEEYDSQTLYTRLAELEDKIESGKLIEIPAPLGSDLWHIQMPRHKIKGRWYESLTDYKNATVEKLEWCLSLSNLGLVGTSYFVTKEQAEAKLKELQENKT